MLSLKDDETVFCKAILFLNIECEGTYAPRCMDVIFILVRKRIKICENLNK